MSREVPLDTQRRQTVASEPGLSAWVSANAGSGKTHVLAQRVVRLLLAGTPPSKILCLTFTKAAAANMSLRVFNTLSAWTRLDDASLSAEIAKIQNHRTPDAALIVEARRLFARAVETPGGLKIQTIHAFCERLLHLFPFEANVAAGFEVLSDEEQQELLQRAREHAFADLARHDDPEAARALTILSGETSENEFDELVAAALKHRSAIATAIRDHQGARNWGAGLAQRLGLSPGEDLAALEDSIQHGGIRRSEWKAMAAALMRGGANDQKLAQCLSNADRLSDATSCVETYFKVFFTGEGKPRGLGKQKIIGAALQKLEPTLLSQLENERERLVLLRDKRRCAQVVERSVALFHVIEKILGVYADLKSQRGLLDFDDLIERTSTLLSRSSAAWVLYKLDAGIDHILVDEAQDTSPTQWRILQKVAEDFTSGEGARGNGRTFFAVGDEKQSIFSFQGAAPGEFDKMRKEFARAMAQAEKQFEAIRLNLSFRSVGAVLQAVDDVFDDPANRLGVVAKPDNVWVPHQAWKKELPGLVEIWNEIGASGIEDPAEWKLPVDRDDKRDPHVLVAQRIAGRIRGWLSPSSLEAVHGEDGRPRRIRAGDILILVRRRSGFFEAVIRALKDAGVPVAGADRLVLNEHIAVMDLVAAGRAALLPEDDLTLACVLKSPLVGLDDDDLIAIAPQRPGSLWDALAASTEPRHQAACATLLRWRQEARARAPFAFYSWLLGAEGGRRKMLARLGPEAGDAMDEFLRLALEHERMHPPSLVTFLHQLETTPVEIKRDMEAAGDAVRVMTVHGSKGLEAKIVFLPDTMGAPGGRHDAKLFDIAETEDESWLVWARSQKLDSDKLAERRRIGREAQEEEYRRLLYVAMTRAEERLYIAGFYQTQRPKGGWYDIVREALMASCETVPASWDASETVLRRGEGARLVSTDASVALPAATASAPDWLLRSAPFEASPAPPISPSNALGAADQQAPAAASGRAAMKSAAFVGRIVHALLQHLPDIEPSRRREAGDRYLKARAENLPELQRVAILEDVLRLIDDPALAEIFGEGSRVEVAVSGRLARPGGRDLDVAGQIDRLAIGPDGVWIADFKTGRARPVDDTPQTYLTQLALYRAVMAELYPGRSVRALLVWTAGPSVVEIEAGRLDAALERVLRG